MNMESWEVIDWFNINKFKIPKISYFASIIYSIPPSQIENARDFWLARVIARAKRATLTAENLAILVFINKNNGNKSNKETSQTSRQKKWTTSSRATLMTCKKTLMMWKTSSKKTVKI